MEDFKLTSKENKAIAETFTPYLFYQYQKNGDIECWCTSCEKHFMEPRVRRTMRPIDYEFRQGLIHNEYTRCPLCERKAISKQTGKAKGCRNLCEEKRVVILRRINQNFIKAESFYCYKSYAKDSYFLPIRISPSKIYELKPEEVRVWERSTWSYQWNPLRTVSEPFHIKSAWCYCNQPDNTYTVIGTDNLKNSFMKYQQVELYKNTRLFSNKVQGDERSKIMKYFCYFVLYPQLEMIQKMGYDNIVNDLVNAGIKNHPHLDWKAKKIYEFFKLSKQEYNQVQNVIGSRKNDIIDFLQIRYQLKKLGVDFSIQSTGKYFKAFDKKQYNFQAAIDLFKNNKKVSVIDGIEYLILQGKKHYSGSANGARIDYADYIRMAKDLKLGHSKEALFPAHLSAAHDRAVSMRNAIYEERRQKEAAEKAAKLQKNEQNYFEEIHKKNLKQYDFCSSDFKIVVPATAREIIDEGIAMHHCVGGYAERHLNGKLTILFLRSLSAPDKSLYTIEMHGTRMQQIQGMRNRTPLTPEAKEFFDNWLSWVQEGSKRDKKGNPILQEKISVKSA